ncbi:hypothetical protein KYLE_95 [Pantoea phage Kyle]|uniref:Uncharacterized protein n=1 Tax=Pantoea phage Kyle TaxID=2589665 RepID=A0A514A8S0_9CAUD|nr:hypothetical protein HWC52_gp095 [Pantoea phage Kyle]QDH49624.1 hypothetical protein KYLE_95 [Pantoea phage Kyle]
MNLSNSYVKENHPALNEPKIAEAIPSKHHLRIQLCAQRYINLLLCTLYPLKNVEHPDNGDVFRHENLRRKTNALVMHDRVLTNRVEIDVRKWL